jgi:hypothetical protein
LQSVNSRSARGPRRLIGLGAALCLISTANTYGNGEPASYLGLYSADAIFIMEKAAAQKGDTVILTMSIESWRPIQGFDYALYFDARKLELISVAPVLSGGIGWDHFESHVLDRVGLPCVPDQCFLREDVWGRAVFSESDPGADLPGNTRNDVLEITFRVHDDAPSAFVDVEFLELYVNPDEPGTVDWNNQTHLRDGGTGHVFYSDVRFQGGILVDPPVGVPFLRGDANADGQLSVSDAIMIRRSLFQGGRAPSCIDAEDVDDNGTVQITDGIRLLEHVLLSSLDDLSNIAQPFPAVGLDPNLDALPCASYAVHAPEPTDDVVRLGAVEASPGDVVAVPIYISSTVEVEGYQLFVAYDPQLFTPLGPTLDLGGTIFEASEASGFNGVNTTLAEGMVAIGFVGDLTRGGFEIPAGVDVLAGKLRGIVSAGATPGTEIRLELTNGPGGEGYHDRAACAGEQVLRPIGIPDGEGRLGADEGLGHGEKSVRRTCAIIELADERGDAACGPRPLQRVLRKASQRLEDEPEADELRAGPDAEPREHDK